MTPRTHSTCCIETVELSQASLACTRPSTGVYAKGPNGGVPLVLKRRLNVAVGLASIPVPRTPFWIYKTYESSTSGLRKAGAF